MSFPAFRGVLGACFRGLTERRCLALVLGWARDFGVLGAGCDLETVRSWTGVGSGFCRVLVMSLGAGSRGIRVLGSGRRWVLRSLRFWAPSEAESQNRPLRVWV